MKAWCCGRALQARALSEAEAAVRAATAAPVRAANGGAAVPSSPPPRASMRGPALAGVDLAAQQLRLGLPGRGSAAGLAMDLARRIADYFARLGDSLSCATDLRRGTGPQCALVMLLTPLI